MRFAILSLFALIGCTSGAVVTHDPTGALGTCPAPAFQEFVGQPYAQTRVQWSSLRIIRPGDAVTKDFREDRLNIDLGETDVIARIWCG